MPLGAEIYDLLAPGARGADLQLCGEGRGKDTQDTHWIPIGIPRILMDTQGRGEWWKRDLCWVNI